MPREELKLYNKIVIDHLLNPRNVGEIKDAYNSRAENPRCGDIVKLWAKIDAGIIKKVTMKTFG